MSEKKEIDIDILREWIKDTEQQLKSARECLMLREERGDEAGEDLFAMENHYFSGSLDAYKNVLRLTGEDVV